MRAAVAMFGVEPDVLIGLIDPARFTSPGGTSGSTNRSEL
jgi:hypothetical protein